MELVMLTNDLMPAGKPKFMDVVKYPKISNLVASEGRKRMLTIMVLMVKDFCTSMNVVRNMNEDQMIESANMLLEECDNFRMEDYIMMFSMAKKGTLEVKIYDRIDIQLIAQIMDAYWLQRKHAGKKSQEENAERFDTMGVTTRTKELMSPEEARQLGAADGMDRVVGIIREISIRSADVFQDMPSAEMAKQQIEKNPNYRNNHKPVPNKEK